MKLSITLIAIVGSLLCISPIFGKDKVQCKSNQECIKLRDCPYTKKLLTRVLSSSDREEKNNMIAEMRKLVCNPSDRSVCCDIEESEAEAEAEGNHEVSDAKAEGDHEESNPEAEGDHEESNPEAEGDHEESEAEAEGDHEESEAEAEGDHEESDPEAEGDHEDSEAEAEGDHEESDPEAEGNHEDSEAEAEGDHEESNPEAEGDHEESEAEAEGSDHDDQNKITDTLVNHIMNDFPHKVGVLSELSEHELAGELWATDKNTLEFRKFTYEGDGPDAFFMIGTHDADEKPNLDDGIPIPYSKDKVFIQKLYDINDDIPALPEFKNEQFKITLPPGIHVSDLKWLSVYCRKFTKDFGNVKFSDHDDQNKITDTLVSHMMNDFPYKIGVLSELSEHELAGELWATDKNTLEFRKFTYEGDGPDAFFMIGTHDADENPNLDDGIPIPYSKDKVFIQKLYDINDDIPALPEFKNEQFKITLPPGIHVSDLKWLSVYCRKFTKDFGNVKF